MPLDLLIEQVEPKACHLINLPKRLWVFGGVCNQLPQESTSLRDSFWKKTLTSTLTQTWMQELDRPEQHEHWWAFSGYKDLLTFERDACYLARGIILFAESPGSLAELGALAIDDAILPKLLVVIQSKYLDSNNRQSFLNLGPIERVRNIDGHCIIDPPSDKELMENDFDTVIDKITSWLPNTQKSSILNVENPTHRLLLLADIIDLLLVSKLTELKKAVNFFEIKISDEEILRALALLDFFGFVKLEERGNEKFWVGHSRSNAPWINYKSNRPETHFDRSRFKIACSKLIENDPRRKALLERSK